MTASARRNLRTAENAEFAEVFSDHLSVLCVLGGETLAYEVTVTALKLHTCMQTPHFLHDFKFIYLTCDTREELKHNLNKLKKKPGYGILYLSFHGHPGQIVLDQVNIRIESLASYMGRGFENWVVHFGSCETIDIEMPRISRFIEVTGVSLVMGYKKDVNWSEAAALDFLILDWLQWYKDMRRMWSRFKKNYKDLISITGLRAFHKRTC